MDRFMKVGTGEEGMAVSDQQPKLNKITISCEMELEGTGEKLGMTLEAVGQDVMGRLMDLVELGIIDRPNPMWVANLPTAGRNKEGGWADTFGSELGEWRIGDLRGEFSYICEQNVLHGGEFVADWIQM